MTEHEVTHSKSPEKTEIVIGKIVLRRTSRVLWMIRPDGEAMQVNEADFEKVLLSYYQTNF